MTRSAAPRGRTAQPSVTCGVDFKTKPVRALTLSVCGPGTGNTCCGHHCRTRSHPTQRSRHRQSHSHYRHHRPWLSRDSQRTQPRYCIQEEDRSWVRTNNTHFSKNRSIAGVTSVRFTAAAAEMGAIFVPAGRRRLSCSGLLSHSALLILKVTDLAAVTSATHASASSAHKHGAFILPELAQGTVR